MPDFINISYGSNLHPVRLGKRCPTARLVGTSELCGWRLGFHKRGQDSSGKCNAVRTGRPEDNLWVAVFEISDLDKPVLDAAEGLGCGYDETKVPVALGGLRVVGSIYVAHHAAIDDLLKPYDWYWAMVLLGARFHGFPDCYLEMIQALECDEDPDPSSAARHWAIVRDMQRANRAPVGGP